jgi:hypothetical protein
MKRNLTLLLVVSFLSVVTCITAGAQGATAEISGTVKDQSGAVLPGAEITATQTETGALRMTLSNEAGSYVLPNLPVGPYKLEVSLPGFRTFAQTGIVLQVDSSTVVNAVLNVGQVSETVEVQANAALVEARSTGIGQVIENARILELPLVGRQVTDLIPLSGAALPVQTTDTTYRGVYPNTTGFSIAGGLLGGNTYTLDGGMHNDVYANYGLPLPFPDALQEFKVETSSLPAQYGLHSGGAVNAVTKSGTNDFHGSLFEFVRNYGLNARNFFAPVRDQLKRNQYGGTIGGPIRKNKLFFFAGYQGTITRQSPLSTSSYVPTEDMIAGDFTTYASRVCQVKDFILGTPFVNNRLAPSQISPAAVNIAKRLPAPVDQCGRTNWGNPVASEEYFPIGKIDYQMSSTHSMFGRYLGASFKQTPPYAISKNVLSSVAPGADDLLQSLTYGDTYLFGPNMINSFRATWNRTANQKIVQPWFGPSDVGLNIYQYLPGLTSINVIGGFTTGGLVATPSKFRTTVIDLSNDLNVVKGKHQMAFGGGVMGFESNTSGNAFAPGSYTISGITGLALADFMAGKILNIQQGAPNKLLVRYRYLGLYAQDSWKIFPNLTLSYGLRWEPYFPQHYGENMMNHFDMDAFMRGIKSNVFVNAPAGMFYPGDPLFGPNGNAGMNKQWKDFAPRAGLVWDPSKDGKMVIRAGYGIFYDINTVELNLATGQGPPWAGKVVVTAPAGGLDNPYRDFPGGIPFPFVFNRNVTYSNDGIYDTFNANTRVPYVQQWNLGIQRQIGTDWLVSASYIGNEVTHLYGARELDPAVYFPGNAVNGICTSPQGYTIPVASGPCSTVGNTSARRLLRQINPREGVKFSFLDAWDDGGTRSYNGLLLSTEKRFSRGFSFSANYTLSHCIGNPSNTLLNGGAGGVGLYIAPTRAGDRGDCLAIPGITAVGEDRRHIANMTGLINSPKFSNHVLGMFAGNWRLSSILKLQSGSALDVYTGTDDMLSGINATNQRADQISGHPYGNKCTNDLIGPSPTCYWIDKSAFARPASGTVGNMRPGMIRGPGYFNVDAGLSRIFTIKETQRVELRMDATNVFNHTNFLNPSLPGAQQLAFNTLTSSTFGRLQTARDARILQFALKYVF